MAAVVADQQALAPLQTVQTGRMRAIDGLRGLAVLGMILVNNQGSGDHAFWGMAHADWNGWSPADVGRSAGSPRSATGTWRTMGFRSTSSATAYETSRLASAGHG